jgi:CHAD domain-containing protein
MNTTTPCSFLSENVIRRKLNKVLQEVDGYIKPEPLDPTEIHQLRRSIKKLRAWIRLLRKQNGFRKLNKCDRLLGTFANSYSSMRDTHVAVQTLQWLQEWVNALPDEGGNNSASAEQSANVDFTAGIALLQSLPADAAVLQDPELSSKVLDVMQQVADSTSAAGDKEILRQGMRQTWRKAKRVYKVAKEDPTAANLHRLRRWVKHLCNQFELTLVLGTSGPVRQMHKHLVSLAAQLGRYHDIVVLWENMPAVNKPKAKTDTFAREKQQIEQVALKAGLDLLMESMNLADLCFSKTPKSFTDGLKENR